MTRKYSNEELLGYLREYADGRERAPRQVFDDIEKYPSSTLYSNRFGAWNNAKELAGVTEKTRLTKEDVLEDIKRCQEKHDSVKDKYFRNDPEIICTKTIYRHFDSLAEAKFEAGIEEKPRTCPDCGGKYGTLGRHFSETSCSENLSERQYELIKGVALSDGYISWKDTTPSMGVALTNRPALEWIDEQLAPYSHGVKDCASAELRASISRQSGFQPDASAEKYDDMWYVLTSSMESLRPMADWYSDDGKNIPSTVDISPESLRMWYICDGGVMWNKFDGHPRIHTTKYCFDSDSVIESVLSNYPGEFEVWEKSVAFRDVDVFIDYVGERVPGFEYKWEFEDRERYTELMESTK